ncbi:geranylgeranylglycerol-phosphate geranylgeranyltransferase [Tamlana sp. 2201CG12-4]|uniref:geranylgeranylglycerol-phosphate geranylgeranyltransferase n=1 Tax=Tamlana sp. 2201CG12-4 TaxID=3112582 RepID=UPI002DB929EF|nr:geranylgeranylglycerol-phosphate geranylgeranyltransferase [Tamlana sp. 2201CG12-4]MEC3908447.1 geranylgeranylglycerol-phosphate geranylgeranyltransferase [Tamlana sp. 2201CG12-4]
MKFLILIRYKNLLMIALVQLLIKYAFLEPFGAVTSLDGFGISLLIMATVCIAAAGNIINDINDIETDLVNKPERIIIGKAISEKLAYNLFIGLNLTGVALGFYLSHRVGSPSFFTIFILVSALLYIYATYLKQTFLIGNLIVSLLVAISILIAGFFELLPVMTISNRPTQIVFFKSILDYAIFAFTLNLLREIAKDIEDIDGDYKAGMNTLPIALGRDRAKNILSVLNFIPLAGIIYYMISNLYKQQIAVIYFLLLIIAPLIYICIKTFNAQSKKEFHHISSMYKLVMLFGMLSLLLYKYVILN